MSIVHLGAFRVRMLCAYKAQMTAAGYYLMEGNIQQLNWALEDALYFWMKSDEIH